MYSMKDASLQDRSDEAAVTADLPSRGDPASDTKRSLSIIASWSVGLIDWLLNVKKAGSDTSLGDGETKNGETMRQTLSCELSLHRLVTQLSA